MKKYLMIIMLLLFVLVFSACKNPENENVDLAIQNNPNIQSDIKQQGEKDQTKEDQIEKDKTKKDQQEGQAENKQTENEQIEKDQTEKKQTEIDKPEQEQLNTEKPEDSWESAYKDIIRNASNNLVDPYELRESTNEKYYLGVHDFDQNGVPELILGDGASVGVFTYKNNVAEKVADLYEPEDWMVINGLHYKNNTIVLESDGSGGIGYVCFTFYEGKYATGSHDDYNPKEAILNDKPTSYEEFSKIFSITDLMDNSIIPLINIKINKSNAIITLSEGKDDTNLDDFDFNDIMW